MPTKLSRFAEGIMEAAWIAAIVMTPLFFNKYSSRIFEPDKATLVRTLALVILGAWLIKVIESGLSNRDPDKTWRQNFVLLLREPIVPWVLALALVYLLATLFSVTPRISFWGSYQRLQGFYSTLGYLVLFASLAANLRRKAQLDRLITTAILTSLPVSLYGVLQHYGIDPIPWGGNVTNRVASHMGNSIFVAAYLILIFPLAVGRIVQAFGAILREDEHLSQHVARSTVYIFIAALQLIAIYFSGSRGPFLGLVAGSFFLFILLSLHWKKRWMTIATVVLAGLAGVFLLVLNIPGGPLESIREAPAVGRLGQVFDLEQRTSKVRILIWQGAAEMVAPHAALEYPDGHTDPFNFLRPILGHGPETMHMAYNPFYPPELAQTEKRNASPDRSHNETWDSLVMTGGLGLIVYLGLFLTVFYFGLKWLGLINSPRQRIVFLILALGAGIASAIGFSLWQGAAFLGVGLPFGIVLGLIGYLTLAALFVKASPAQSQFNPERAITLIVLLAAILGHFVEINFGIAIVSTRTHFWMYAAFLLLAGAFLPPLGEYNLPTAPVTAQALPGKKKPSRSRGTVSQPNRLASLRPIAISTGITTLLLLPLFYEYVANMKGDTATFEILWSSLTRVQGGAISYGVLALLLTTWLAASVLFATEEKHAQAWGKAFLKILGIAAGLALFYGFWLSGTLASLARTASQKSVISQAIAFEGLLTQYYGFLLLFIAGLAFFLPKDWPQRSVKASLVGVIAVPVALVLVLWLSAATNWRIIRADIAFKMAEPLVQAGQWSAANAIYQHAKELAPSEDYYDLFLGRGYLEEAKTISDPAEQEKIFQKAESDLQRAQKSNPLNPDHTANLARLYSWWAGQTDEKKVRLERGNVSDQYYSRVLVLSPNSARLWDEWAILHLNVLNNPDRALELLNHSLEIDPLYDWTHALLGDYYSQLARKAETDEARSQAYQQAIAAYRQAIDTAPPGTLRTRQGLNYFFVLANTYQLINDLENVATTLEASLKYAGKQSDIWKIEENLARTYYMLNDKSTALMHAQNALAAAPDSEQERLAQLVAQIQAAP